MFDPGSKDESDNHVLFNPRNIDLLKTMLKDEVTTELIRVGEMPSADLEYIIEPENQEWIQEIFQRLLRISSTLKIQQWTYCELDLSEQWTVGKRLFSSTMRSQGSTGLEQ